MALYLLRNFKAKQKNGVEWLIEIWVEHIRNPNQIEPFVNGALVLKTSISAFSVFPVPGHVNKFIVCRNDEEIEVTTDDPNAPTKQELD